MKRIYKVALCLLCLSLGNIAYGLECPKDSFFRPIDVFLDINYIGSITLYCKSYRDSCKSLRNDFDDIVMFTIQGKNDSMFYVTAFSGLTDSVIGNGWIYKASHLGIFSSAYNDNMPLQLFESPSENSKVVLTEPKYNPDVYEIIDANRQHWLKVRTHVGNRTFEGWMPPSKQCANPYTTCS